jgi:hypothetical protein
MRKGNTGDICLHGVSLFHEVLAGFVTRLDTPPSSNRHHPVSAIAPFDQRAIVTDLDLRQFDKQIGRYSQSLARLLQICQCRSGDRDQFAVELNTIGPTTCELDSAGALLGRAAMIAPRQTGVANQRISLLQQARHHPHSILQQAAVALFVQ